MKLGIRAKMLAVLFVASVLPLALGVISLQVFGYDYYRKNQGLLYQNEATQLARTLNITANTQIEKLSDWVTFTDPNIPAAPETPTPSQIQNAWARYTSTSPVVARILRNDLSRKLRAFQKVNPLFREIFITDKSGFIIAATNKTDDYIQNDESWWLKTRELPSRVAWLEGIRYDDSARIHSLNVSLCLRDERTGAFRGVVKGVVNASAMFVALPRQAVGSTADREVVLKDGRILTQLFHRNYAPLSKRYENFSHLIGARPGWATITLKQQTPRGSVPDKRLESELVGFAPLHLNGVGVERIAVAGVSPMFVLVRQSESELLAPVRGQLWRLGLGGGVLLLAFALIGLWIADSKIIRPLRLLSQAANGIAQSARIEDGAVPDPQTQSLAHQAVERCHTIQTGDEISSLADDFASMGERVLRYHDHLEKEIAEKTGEIQRDLQMAREFQEALLPRAYPHLTATDENGVAPALGLRFHHIYKPALTVGGDFFDVFKLSDHQAGIFVADVMGHGARSALITAILRTILLDLSMKTAEPAELMRLINRHFYDIVQGSGQFVFVSAFCLVLDTRHHLATYSNAGHPSPLFAEGATARVLPLLGHTGSDGIHTNAALGLAADSTYQSYSRPMSPGDAFLLYTDGVVEAPNPHGDEFGMAQLEHVVALEIARQPENLNVAALCQSVMASIGTWMQGVPSPDDICLVAVGIDGPEAL